MPPRVFPLDASLPAPEQVRRTISALAALQAPRVRAAQDSGELPPCTEHRYGPHPQQTLDLFLPRREPQRASPAPAPLVVFVFGGGFTRGDKRLLSQDTPAPFYGNVALFFTRQGYAVANINYRLAPQHGARFPSGGEDVARALEYLSSPSPDTPAWRSAIDPHRIFLLGTSAGAFHGCTFLWCPPPGGDGDGGGGGGASTGRRTWTYPSEHYTLRGFLCANLPAHFARATPDREAVLRAYLGGGYARAGKWEEGSSDVLAMRGWRRGRRPSQGEDPQGGRSDEGTRARAEEWQAALHTPTLLLTAEFDLPLEVVRATEDLVAVWDRASGANQVSEAGDTGEREGGDGSGESDTLPGPGPGPDRLLLPLHNHFSAVFSLGLPAAVLGGGGEASEGEQGEEEEEEEAWTRAMLSWMEARG